jgi:pimeloyl-ACP methyl ester carboxylesterase
MIWMAVLFPPILLGSSFYGLRWGEYAVTFHPQPYASGEQWKRPQNSQEVSFLNRRNQRLSGWLVKSSAQPRATVIFFHGQSGNIANVGWIGTDLASRGFDVLLFDYRGYGKSEGEIADEADLYEDADAAYDYVVGSLGVSPKRVVLYGHSLGTTAAVDLASRRSCGAIILESGLSSAKDMAEVKLPWLPKWLYSFGRNRFDSEAKLRHVTCPVFVVHGEPDNVVPTREGRTLFTAANSPKQLLIVPGAGHSVASFGGENYFTRLENFINESLAGRLDSISRGKSPDCCVSIVSITSEPNSLMPAQLHRDFNIQQS